VEAIGPVERRALGAAVASGVLVACGTAAMMLPYSVAFGVAWTALLLVWIALGIPLGPGAAAGCP